MDTKLHPNGSRKFCSLIRASFLLLVGFSRGNVQKYKCCSMPRSCCHIKRFGLLDLHRVQTMLKIQFRIHTYLQTFGPKFGILDLFPAHRCPKISNLGSACEKDIGRDIQGSLHSTHLFVLSDKPFYHVVFSLKLCRCCFCSKKWHHLWCPSSGHARGGCRIWYMMRGSISLIMSCMLMHICCRSKGAHCRHG